jgi:hypothetical protein
MRIIIHPRPFFAGPFDAIMAEERRFSVCQTRVVMARIADALSVPLAKLLSE